NPKRILNAAGKGLSEIEEPQPPCFWELVRMLPLQLLENRTEPRLGLRAADAGLEPPQQKYLAFALYRLTPVAHIPKVSIRPAPHDAAWHHSDYRPPFAVEAKLTAEYREVAAELALPEFVAEHRHRLGVFLSIRRHRGTADHGAHPHDVERVHRAVIPA